MTHSHGASPLRPELRYLRLRFALQRFGKPAAALAPGQREIVEREALAEWRLHRRVLSSAEAGGVDVPAAIVEAALRSIRRRYSSEQAFRAALRGAALDEVHLRAALAQELRVEATVERVAAGAPDTTEERARAYYQSHAHRFRVPETRTARHILVTVNPEYSENTRDEARRRIGRAAAETRRSPSRFPALAQRISECPTALQGGLLGKVKRGQLYPELDQALFVLPPGEVSAVAESPLGFHLLRCDAVDPERPIPWEEAAPRIREKLREAHRRRCLRAWLERIEPAKAADQ